MSYIKNHKITLVILLLLLFLALAYTFFVVTKDDSTSNQDSQAYETLANTGDQSPYTTISGNSVSLTNYIGTIMVAHSWASWCPQCKDQLIELSELTETINEVPVTILAINRAEPASTARLYLRSLEVNEKVQLVLDADDRFYKSIAGYTMPETIIYDQDGTIARHIRGYVSNTELELIISEITSS